MASAVLTVGDDDDGINAPEIDQAVEDEFSADAFGVGDALRNAQAWPGVVR